MTFVAALWLIPPTVQAKRDAKDFDIAGAALVNTAMLLMVFTLVETPNAGWISVRTLGSLLAVVVLLVLFVVVERRVAQPLVRLGILRSPTLVRANIGAMALIDSWIGVLFVITLYLQEFRGWSAMETGLAVSPAGLVAAILSTRIAAQLVSRFGTPRVILTGLAFAAV